MNLLIDTALVFIRTIKLTGKVIFSTGQNIQTSVNLGSNQVSSNKDKIDGFSSSIK